MTPLADLSFIEPADRRQWRAWLEANHADSPGVWLAVGKKGNTVTTLTYQDAVEEAVCFGWIDSVVNRLDEVETLAAPADLAAALAVNPGAEHGFAALPPSTRKQLLYWVANAKRPVTREKRIAEIVAAAAENRPVRPGPAAP